MRAFLLEVPEALAAERRRTGADRWDEVWEGLLHMVPPPSGWHRLFGGNLYLLLAPLAKARGFECTYETGVFKPGAGEKDYRQPDLVVAPRGAYSKPGIVGAPELVVEILSPNDESYEKLPFYESLGVKEVLLLNPETHAVELFVLRGGKLHAALPDAEAAVRSAVLGVSLARIDGPKLRLVWNGGASEI
jgi:Uma2 family endonuclease